MKNLRKYTLLIIIIILAIILLFMFTMDNYYKKAEDCVYIEIPPMPELRGNVVIPSGQATVPSWNVV
jgi:hypothetical protein